MKSIISVPGKPDDVHFHIRGLEEDWLGCKSEKELIQKMIEVNYLSNPKKLLKLKLAVEEAENSTGATP